MTDQDSRLKEILTIIATKINRLEKEVLSEDSYRRINTWREQTLSEEINKLFGEENK